MSDQQVETDRNAFIDWVRRRVGKAIEGNETFDSDNWSSDEAFEAFLAGAEYGLKQASFLVPDGWKLVPIKPTQRMLEAGYWNEETSLQTQVDAYRRMLDAVPGR